MIVSYLKCSSSCRKAAGISTTREAEDSFNLRAGGPPEWNFPSHEQTRLFPFWKFVPAVRLSTEDPKKQRTRYLSGASYIQESTLRNEPPEKIFTLESAQLHFTQYPWCNAIFPREGRVAVGLPVDKAQ